MTVKQNISAIYCAEIFEVLLLKRSQCMNWPVLFPALETVGNMRCSIAIDTEGEWNQSVRLLEIFESCLIG